MKESKHTRVDMTYMSFCCINSTSSNVTLSVFVLNQVISSRRLKVVGM